MLITGSLTNELWRCIYPLSRPNEVQDRLKGSTVFSTLDPCSGFWQMPVHADDQPKAVYCPGPGFGLFQFCKMPFGLSGAPSSFQRLINTIRSDLPFVTTYFRWSSCKTKDEHAKHFALLFQQMSTDPEKFQSFTLGLHQQMVVHSKVSLD